MDFWRRCPIFALSSWLTNSHSILVLCRHWDCVDTALVVRNSFGVTKILRMLHYALKNWRFFVFHRFLFSHIFCTLWNVLQSSGRYAFGRFFGVVVSGQQIQCLLNLRHLKKMVKKVLFGQAIMRLLFKPNMMTSLFFPMRGLKLKMAVNFF